MNGERCPEEDAAIAFRRQGQNLQVRKLAEQRIAEARSLAGLIQSDDQKVRFFFLDDSADVGFVLDFADDLDVRFHSPLLQVSDNEEIKEGSSWSGAKRSQTYRPGTHRGDSSVPKKYQF